MSDPVNDTQYLIGWRMQLTRQPDPDATEPEPKEECELTVKEYTNGWFICVHAEGQLNMVESHGPFLSFTEAEDAAFAMCDRLEGPKLSHVN